MVARKSTLMLASLDIYQLARPVLHRLDPEIAHEVGLRALETGLVPRQRFTVDPILATSLHGWPLEHPLGLAAGFDKNARVVEQMYDLGFSFVEVGGVTPLPQAGNPRPRVFRLPEDRAVINRMGFPNDGADRVERRLKAANARGLLGVNIASNAESSDPLADFCELVRRFAPLSDYLMLDISCPNTSNGRLFLEPARLEELLVAVRELDTGPRRAVFIAKIAPDLDDVLLEKLLAVMLDRGIDGICVGNTTLQRPPSLLNKTDQRGGLSGPPLRSLSTKQLAFVYRIVAGRVPLIGTGGIAHGADAYEKVRAGANLLQLYTALVYHGPRVVIAILDELAVLLRRDGFTSISEAVGTGL